MLPNEIFSLGLKPRDLAVLACLIRHKDNENDSCFPSRSLIIKKHRLRENGSHTSNMYFVADIFAMTQNNPKNVPHENHPVTAFQK